MIKTRIIGGVNIPKRGRIFAPVFNYLKGELENNYLVSNYGEIISLQSQTPKMLGGSISSSGYRVFRPGRGETSLYIHVVVWFSFAYQYYCDYHDGYPKPQCCDEIKTIEDFKEYIRDRKYDLLTAIHHLDLDKMNNHLSNLLHIGKNIHDALHRIRRMEHEGMSDPTDTASVSARIRNLDIGKPTLFDPEGGCTMVLEDYPQEEISKYFNAVAVFNEPLMKACIFDTWCQMINEFPTRALKIQYAKVELKKLNMELFYMIPQSKEWQGLPDEQIFTFDFIRRITQHKEWLDNEKGINIYVVQD